jgi:integral membrane sensor domain MASE1
MPARPQLSFPTFVAGATALPGTFLGSFLLNLWIGLTQIVTALVIAAGSMTQAAIGGAALRRTIGYPEPFRKPSDVLLFFLLAPILCLTSATISLGGMWALGVVKLPDLPMNWAMWWLGDMVGVLVALPLMIWLTDEP